MLAVPVSGWQDLANSMESVITVLGVVASFGKLKTYAILWSYLNIGSVSQ